MSFETYDIRKYKEPRVTKRIVLYLDPSFVAFLRSFSILKLVYYLILIACFIFLHIDYVGLMSVLDLLFMFEYSCLK